MKKVLLMIAGSFSLALGIVGIVLPLLPTTPFLLLAAACYLRSSERLYTWLINHKYLGSFIKSYREHRAIPLRAKLLAIGLLWLTIGFSVFFVMTSLIGQLALLAIAAGVTIHLLSLKTIC